MGIAICGYDVLLMQRPIVCGRPIQRDKRTRRLSIEERAAETHAERIKRSNALVAVRSSTISLVYCRLFGRVAAVLSWVCNRTVSFIDNSYIILVEFIRRGRISIRNCRG